MKPNPIKLPPLTPAEVLIGGLVADMRLVQNMKWGTKHKYGASLVGRFERDGDGACSEQATAKWLDRHWNGNIGDKHAADIGDDIDVKHTNHDDGKLIVHPDSHDDWYYVLVTGTVPTFTVRGWLFGREAKQQQFWAELQPNRPAFCVPQDMLRDPRELALIANRHRPTEHNVQRQHADGPAQEREMGSLLGSV
jgi:hypothetical protein